MTNGYIKMMALVYILVIIFLIALILAGLTFIVMIDFIIRVTTEYDGIADAIHAKREIQRSNHD